MIPQPAIDPRFNLAGVNHAHDVALRRQNRLAQFAAALQVLQVHLVVATPAQRVRSGVGIADWQGHAVGAGREKPLRLGDVAGRLDRDADFDQGFDAGRQRDQLLHVLFLVAVQADDERRVQHDALRQADEVGVVLGECIGPLVFILALIARCLDPGGRDLDWRLDALGA